MNELTSLMIEFKRNSIERVFNHLGNEDMDGDTCSTVSNNQDDEPMNQVEDEEEEDSKG
jgi:hypothetical protein